MTHFLQIRVGLILQIFKKIYFWDKNWTFETQCVEHLFFNHTEPRGIEQAKQKIRESKKCASGMRVFEMLRRETQQA